MVQRQGVDVRGGNWIFHNNGLLVAQDMPKERLNNTLLLPTPPDELREILQVNKSELLRTSENFYRQTRENNPNGRIYRPWLYTLKLAHYADTFTTGLTADSEALTPAINANANDNYPREAIREPHHPYLDLFDDTSPFVWRVPGRMSGYNAARDGLWLQIKGRFQYEDDRMNMMISAAFGD